MKEARYTILLLLLSLLLTGCERRDVHDKYSVSEVQVKLLWNGVTDKLPEGMRIIFYPKDGGGRKVDKYLSVGGGEVKVPPGQYAVVVYNYDTETVTLRDEESYDRVEAHPRPYTELGVETGMVWAPEAFYAAKIDELTIEESDEVLVVELRPQLTVYTYTFEVKATGLKNVSAITGNVAGMDVCYALGCRDCSTCPSSPVFFEAEIGDGVIKGSFTAFGPLAHSVATRAGIEVLLTLELKKIDGEVQQVKVDITKVVTPPPPPGGGGGDNKPPKEDIEIEIPIPDDGIVVDDVKPIPPSGGGGIGGDVGDWGEGVEEELPIN